MTDSYVCSGATMKCTMGTSNAKLTVLPSRTVYLTGQPMANISDHVPMKNLAPFGRCRSLGFPATASATAAHHGHLTPMPCMHNTPMPWMNDKNDYIVKGFPALLRTCKCQCMWGGIISLVTNGQGPSRPSDPYVPRAHQNSGRKADNDSSFDGIENGSINNGNQNNSDQASSTQKSGNQATIRTKSLAYYRAWLKTMTKEERVAFFQAYKELPDDWTTIQRLARIEKLLGDTPSTLSKLDRMRIASNYIKLEKALGVSKGNRMTTADADRQNANPKHEYKYKRDPNGPETVDGVKCRKNPDYDKQYSINCATCAAAYALRLMGFDVKAKGNKLFTKNRWLSKSHSFDIWKNPDGTKPSPSTTQDWMKKNNVTSMTPDSYRKYFDETCSEPGVYIVTVQWAEDGGHATILQREEDGQLYYIEPQVYYGNGDGRHSVDDLIFRNGNMNLSASPPSGKGILRVDDKMLDPEYASLFEV